MNLTEVWKNKKLQKHKFYWIKFSFGSDDCFPALLCGDNAFYGGKKFNKNMDIEVLAPCDYYHFVGLTEKVKTLTSENKHLSDLLANQDNEVERLREENATLNKVFETDFDVLVCDVTNVKQKDQTIEQLREVLKECRPALSHLGKWNTQRQYLLTKINEVMK